MCPEPPDDHVCEEQVSLPTATVLFTLITSNLSTDISGVRVFHIPSCAARYGVAVGFSINNRSSRMPALAVVQHKPPDNALTLFWLS